MDFLDLAESRYSVRKFSSKKVEKEKLDLVLEAGRAAPTAVNYQPQRILVLNSEEELEKLKACTPYHFNAPLVLLVCYDETKSWKRKFDDKDEGSIDASIVATHMMLEAANIGLGSTWVGYFDPQKMKNLYALPDHIVPVALLPMGYPDDSSKPHPNHDMRFDISTTVFYHAFPKDERA